jgi:hypothetical protein
MSAMEKVAWTELAISVAAVVVATALYPWLGNSAASAFALLGLLPFSIWFLRRRGPGVLVDERDQAIDRRATQLGVSAAWMFLFTGLIVIGLWSNYFNESVVATRLQTWLIWIQFAICYGVKGFVGVVSYRRQSRAA